jgi:hypothetical protein
MFKTFARFIAPPGMPAPVLWGDERIVAERFGSGVAVLRMTLSTCRFDYPFPPAEVVELFRQNYGPTTRAFATLGDADQAALRDALINLWSTHNTAIEPTRTLVDADYLEVIATRA